MFMCSLHALNQPSLFYEEAWYTPHANAIWNKRTRQCSLEQAHRTFSAHIIQHNALTVLARVHGMPSLHHCTMRPCAHSCSHYVNTQFALLYRVHAFDTSDVPVHIHYM